MSEQLKKMSVRELVCEATACQQIIESGSMPFAAHERAKRHVDARLALEAIITELESRCGGSQPDTPKVPEGCVMLHDGRVVKVKGSLSFTADGVLVTGGAIIFVPGGMCIATIGMRGPKAPVGNGLPYTIDQCYSTREAALSAKGVNR